METKSVFLNGVYEFTGAGLASANSLGGVGYVVPSDKRAQLLYIRAGNSSAELVVVIFVKDGKPMRMFPVGAKDAIHVPLVVVEDLNPDTKVEVFVAAPAGVAGHIVLDIGIIEI